jgi:hypothetical protein
MLERTRIVLVAAVVFWGLAQSVQGGPIVWYNGDFDSQNGFPNAVGGFWPPDALAYDNFILTMPHTIDAVFSSNLMNATGVSEAAWEVRSGVSEGDGGTLIASGTSAATQTSLGVSWRIFELYNIRVSGLNVHLGPGEYWLTVAPVAPVGSGRPFFSFAGTTSGLNAMGLPPGNDGRSFLDLPEKGLDFVDYLRNDISMGIEGREVPEPSTLLLLGGGLLAGFCRLRSRRT